MAVTRTWYAWRRRADLEPVTPHPEVIWTAIEQANEMADWFWNDWGSSDINCPRSEAQLCKCEEHVEALDD